MRKLNKNFANEKLTVEAMANSCANGCSCSVVGCTCKYDNPTHKQTTYTSTNSTNKRTFKNAAW